jgi:hypothetical protein
MDVILGLNSKAANIVFKTKSVVFFNAFELPLALAGEVKE